MNEINKLVTTSSFQTKQFITLNACSNRILRGKKADKERK
jgi:hypothetical protein